VSSYPKPDSSALYSALPTHSSYLFPSLTSFSSYLLFLNLFVPHPCLLILQLLVGELHLSFKTEAGVRIGSLRKFDEVEVLV